MIWLVLPVTSNGIDWHWSGISVLQRKTDPPRVTPGCSVCAVGAPTNNLQREMNQYFIITLKRQIYELGVSSSASEFQPGTREV
jgi:hypothetical protein